MVTEMCLRNIMDPLVECRSVGDIVCVSPTPKPIADLKALPAGGFKIVVLCDNFRYVSLTHSL